MPADPCPLPTLEQPLLSVLCICKMWAGIPERCGWSQAPQESTPCSWLRPAVLPLKQPFCLHPCPQSLPVETLGPESGMDPESERAPRAPLSPSKAAAEESAGTLDGGGNGALLRGGCSHLSPMFWGFPVSSGRGRPVGLIPSIDLSLKPSFIPSWLSPVPSCLVAACGSRGAV